MNETPFDLRAAYGDWVLSLAEWEIFETLTFGHGTTYTSAWRHFDNYLLSHSWQEGKTVAVAVGMEWADWRDRPHFHVLYAPGECPLYNWQKGFYTRERVATEGAAYYVAKYSFKDPRDFRLYTNLLTDGVE